MSDHAQGAVMQEAVERLKRMADCHVVDPTPIDALGRFDATYGDLRAVLTACAVTEGDRATYNWRSMDSAPRDGTRVLVCRKAVAGNARNAEPVRTARWKDGSWCSTDPAGSMWTDSVLLAWQHMPEPPPVIVQFSTEGAQQTPRLVASQEPTRAQVAQAFETIRLKLINCLNEPERSAFWLAVQMRDALRAQEASQHTEGSR